MSTDFEIGHERCRSLVCVVCYNKASHLLSKLQTKLVQEFIIEGYTSSNPDFPCGICINCGFLLSKKSKNSDVKLPSVESYDPGRTTGLRSVSICSCKICTVAKMNGLSSLTASRKKVKRGRPSLQSVPTPVRHCSNCFVAIYRGSNHSIEACKRSSQRSKVSQLIKMASPTSIKRAALHNEKDINLQITPLGPPTKVKKVTKELFSAESCAEFQQDLDLSNSKTKVLLQGMRAESGYRKVIEKYAYKKIVEKSHRLDEYFEMRNLIYRFEDKEKKVSKNIETPTVVCSNLPGLIEKVLHERQREKESVLIKISIDGGGGFLKICTSVFNINDPTPKVGGNLRKKFLESGVKKLFIIAVAPNVSELYVNVKRLWLNCGIEKLQHRYTIATDLKLCNVLLGLMNHSSCHPCAWCDADKDNLHQVGNQRTISSLMKLFWDFFESKKDKKDAKHFGNVIHPPIICDNIDDDTPVICLIPPPELHLLLGPVNKLYTELEEEWPECELWLKKCNVKKEDYHGCQFAGNESRKLLKNVDKLEALHPPASATKFITAFRSFNAVVEACYGKNLLPDFQRRIAVFTMDYLKLGISVTPKVHAVFFHVAEFCLLTGQGLGPWSEQAGESVHHDFKQTWKNYKVNDVERDIYSENFLKAVAAYNSKHL